VYFVGAGVVLIGAMLLSSIFGAYKGRKKISSGKNSFFFGEAPLTGA
jgi:hypothetical protein